MIYSTFARDADIQADPSLLSKVRRDKDGYWTYKRNAVAHEGKARVHVEANDYFGGEDSQSYLSRVLVNPTWGTLFKHAKKSQDVTKDYHHNFFETFWVYTVEPCPKTGEDIAIIRLSLGS